VAKQALVSKVQGGHTAWVLRVVTGDSFPLTEVDAVVPGG